MDIARQPRLARLPKKPALVGVLVVLGALLFLSRGRLASAVSPSSSRSNAAVVVRSSVWTDKVQRGDLLRDIPAQGTLIPEHVEWLSATSAGQVSRIFLRAGAEVEPGTLVATLTNADLELAALEAEREATTAEAALIQLDVKTELDSKTAFASLTTMRADLGDAQRHASVADKMGPELVSEIDHADATSKARALAARLDSENARLKVIDQGRVRQLAAQRAELARLRDIAAFARRRLETLEIRSTIKGVLQDVPLEVGQWIPVGTTMGKVAEPGRLKAEIRVAEEQAKDVRRELPVRFDGGLHGHVSRVDPTVTRGTVRLEVALEGDLPKTARTDQTVTGRIEVERLPSVVYVARPSNAVEGSSVSVFKLDADGAGATRTTMRVGRSAAREVEILGGLEPGDEIVVSDVPGAADATSIRFK